MSVAIGTAMSNRIESSTLTPQILLRAYALGLFPMAEKATDAHLFWVDPPLRGVFPLDGLKISSRLAKTLRSNRFEIRIDHNFDAVIEACAGKGIARPDTWINASIHRLFRALFELGHVHTVEVWRAGLLVGGLYGLAQGGAFFGESMFHRETDASKVALVHLVALLRCGGFTLLDTQFVTPHLSSLGAMEITRADYRGRLAVALQVPADGQIWRGSALAGTQALAALQR